MNADISLYGSLAWAAQRLGMSVSTFQRRRSALEADGFPVRDVLVNGYLKSDVDAYVASRSRYSARRVGGGVP